jgi:hypothetical protein
MIIMTDEIAKTARLMKVAEAVVDECPGVSVRPSLSGASVASAVAHDLFLIVSNYR